MLRPEHTQHSSGLRVPKAVEARSTSELNATLQRFAAAGVAASACDSLLRPGLRQLSVGAARDLSGRVTTFLAEKTRPPAERCAGGTFVRPCSHPAAEELAAHALSLLDYFGIAEVEILYDPATQDLFLIEINARPWLQYPLPVVCGCDLLAHALGSFAGAWLAARLAATHKMKFALGIAAFTMIGGIVNAFMLPAPAWFIASDLILAYIPMGWLGGKLARG